MNYTEAADSNTILYATSWLHLRNLKQGWNSLWLFSVKIKLTTTTTKNYQKRKMKMYIIKTTLDDKKYLWGKNVYIVLKFLIYNLEMISSYVPGCRQNALRFLLRFCHVSCHMWNISLKTPACHINRSAMCPRCLQLSLFGIISDF